MGSTTSGAPPETETTDHPGGEPKVEYIALLPQRIVARLDSLATREFKKSRQRLLTWLAEAYDQVQAAQGEVLALERDRAQLEAERAEVAAARETLEVEILRDRRRLELSPDAYDLVHEALEDGVTKSEIVAILRVCRGAGIEPASLAETIRRNLGMAEWTARLQATVAQAEAIRDQATEAATQTKVQAAQLDAEAGALRAQIEQSREQLAAHVAALREVAETLQMLGLFLDLLGDRHVVDLASRDAKLVIGAMILVLSQLRPAACGPFLLPPNAKDGRFVPLTPVSLTDLVGHLGTPADYQRMQQVLAQRAAAGGPAAPEDAERAPEVGGGI